MSAEAWPPGRSIPSTSSSPSRSEARRSRPADVCRDGRRRVRPDRRCASRKARAVSARPVRDRQWRRRHGDAARSRQNLSWTQEHFLEAGYAVAWMRYRAEVDYAYDKIGKLIEDRPPAPPTSQSRPARIRGRHRDHRIRQDAARSSTANRVGYMGMSHGGEMALKIASEYHGFRAMVASEPAAHEFLRLRPGRDRADQSEDRPAQRREDADARAGEGAAAHHRGGRAGARCADRRRRSSCRAATATNCRASSASATICCTSSARTRSGRATSTTCTVSSIRSAMRGRLRARRGAKAGRRRHPGLLRSIYETLAD